MKTATLKQRFQHFYTYPPYPNAATGRQILEKLLNAAIIAASGLGIAAIMLVILATH